MINNKRTFFLGIFIFLIPFLGLPSGWKTTLIIISGLLLIALSVKISLPKRATPKRLRKKERVTSVFVENSPMPKMDGIVSPNEQNQSEK